MSLFLDAVEFEMTYDRRTGKPIASTVCKITPEVGEVLCEERVSGFITTEVKENTEVYMFIKNYLKLSKCVTS